MDGEKDGKIVFAHPRKHTDQAGFSNFIFQSGRIVGWSSPNSAVEDDENKFYDFGFSVHCSWFVGRSISLGK